SIETEKKISTCGHLNGHHSKSCARLIVARLAHRAYRRPVNANEGTELTSVVSQVAKETVSFEEGLSVAIHAMLVSPDFLVRVEGGRATSPIQTQHELASRLAYFLWSSMPDDALLEAADRGRLSRPAVLAAQVQRMLRDPKAQALVENFGGQWL